MTIYCVVKRTKSDGSLQVLPYVSETKSVAEYHAGYLKDRLFDYLVMEFVSV